MDKKKAYWKLLVNTEGNPSVLDIKNLGFSEAFAVETIIRLSQCSPEMRRKIVKSAQAELEKE